MLNDETINYQILDYEMVHWSADDLFIAHKANKITYVRNGEKTVIDMPMSMLGWKRFGLGIRKLRRLLRLDKLMITPITSGFVMFRFGAIYKYDLISKQWLESDFKLNCRNPMYNGLLNIKGVLYAGEYGKPNGIGKRIIKSEDEGITWSAVYQFAPNEIRHIHALMYDQYTDKIWIFTGDADAESRVLLADREFKNVEEIGSGSQEWRACHAIFKSDTVHWLMDSPLKEVHHIIYNRLTKKITIGEKFAGPVWFAKEYEEMVLAASAQEIGPSHVDKKMHLYMSKDMKHWKEIAVFEHDGWPKGYFRFGTITFAHGKNKILSFESVKGLDGKSMEIKL